MDLMSFECPPKETWQPKLKPPKPDVCSLALWSMQVWIGYGVWSVWGGRKAAVAYHLSCWDLVALCPVCVKKLHEGV